MKTLSKLATAAMAAAFLMLNFSSCTKDASPAPSAKTPSLDEAKSLAALELCNKGHRPPPPPKCECKIDSSSFGLTSLLAGSGGMGYTNGTGTGARFFYPLSVTTDASGNIYVGETGDNSIRQITPSGVVTTYAGNPTVYGMADGYRTSATFFNPGPVAYGHDGSLYVVDPNNHLVRKVSPSGVVSTIAGNGVNSTADGPAIGPTVGLPLGIAVDSHNNVFLIDGGNSNLIRKITPQGTISTFAGNTKGSVATDGTGTNAYFEFIYDIAIDASDNIYVTDGEYLTRIRKITPAGVVTTFAGNVKPSASVNGPTISGNFGDAGPLAFDSKGNLFIGNGDNIIEITTALKVVNVAGTAGKSGSANGPGSTATFNHIYGITIDKNDNLYVADQYNNQIRKVIVGLPPCKMGPPPAKPVVSK